MSARGPEAEASKTRAKPLIGEEGDDGSEEEEEMEEEGIEQDELGHGGCDQGVWSPEDYEWDVAEGDWPAFDIDKEAGISKPVQSASGIFVDVFCTRDGVDSFNSFFQTS